MNKDQIEDIYLLTPMQQGILFHTLFAPQADPYFVQTSYTIRGEMNADALEAAGQSVLERHPVLRATPVWEGRAKPIQIIWRHVKLPFQFHDWRDLAPDEQQHRFDSLLLEDVRQGVTLTQSPLMRHALVRLSEQTYKYVLSHHHLLIDGWSSAAVIKEMLLTYEALARGVSAELEQPPRFRDYITWLREQDLEAAGAYWRLQLKGFRAPTPLGMKRQESNGSRTDSPETVGGDGFGEHRLLLSETATARLREFARRQQVTSNTLTQCAWALLLSRYSGEDDVVFGAVVSGRPAGLEGANEMVGLFINTLPVRISVRGGAGVGEWLRGVQAEAVEARRYEYSPLAEVQRWSEVTPGIPLFESVVVFENYPVDQMLQEQAGSMRISGVQGRERTGYPLTLIIGPAGDRLSLLAVYDEQRFEGALVESMLQHFEMLLASMADDPERRVSDVTLLTEEERGHLLRVLNDTARSYPLNDTLPELFRQQVRRTPGAVAVVSGEESLTYAELDERTERLARELRHMGVGPESLVAVLLERSVEMVVALFAVMKAGGAYVPLDPSYPQERLEFMLNDCQAQVLVTERRLLDTLPEHGAQVVCLDEKWEGAATADAGVELAREATSENLAYVIYTSGSTGRPKGAMNTHRAVCNRLLWMQEAYRLGADDSVLQKTPFSFDVSVWEFFWPLINGARLVMARPEGHLDSGYMIETIIAQRITTMHFVPSMLGVFIEHKGVVRCGSLRRVVCSGEALSPELVERFYERLDAPLYNLYGPTEAAIDVTAWECARALGQRTVPIGRPIANTQIYLLDANLRLLPSGVPGELLIGGVGLARGYCRRPGLTAEKFIPDPFSTLAGARLYRTGDIACYLTGGEIEYLGRLDYQVKIRGFRVELGEIELMLARHELVRDAVVMLREDVVGEKRLVAYMVGRDATSLKVDEVRSFLREHLPEHMIPQSFVWLEELPLSPNGKLDRRLLPSPERDREGAHGEYVAPQGDAEQIIAGLWREVLQVERVGVHDNFFDLGGHSLLLLQLHGKLREKFQTELSLIELFEYTTVHAQAERLSKHEPSLKDFESKKEQAAQALRAGRNRLQQQRKHRAAGR
jgi:amino acid adenylation domain-containing protein